MKDLKFVFLVVILICIIAFLYADLKKSKEIPWEGKQLKIGKYIEHFDLIEGNGNVINSSEIMEDKISVVFIYKPKCPSCDPNHYYFQKLAKG